MSDKLNIPVSALTKENVAQELEKSGIDSELIRSIIDILNTCEYARYAPNTGQQEMGNLYQTSIDVISKIENNMRKA
jgi:hypothetical protein